VKKEPRQVDLRFQLGQAYLRAGQKAAAVRELEAALRLDPHSDDVLSALRSARGR
jgi:Tfp pilus assembly protein PilF